MGNYKKRLVKWNLVSKKIRDVFQMKERKEYFILILEIFNRKIKKFTFKIGKTSLMK